MHFGIVEDIDDPRQLGRAKVRVFGLHTHEKAMIPTADLPWASVMQPTTSAANSGIGQNSKVLKGTMVTVTFLDDGMQIPMVIGTVPAELRQYVIEINGVAVPRDPANHGFQDPAGQYPKTDYVGENDISFAARDILCFDHPSRTVRENNRVDDNGNVIYRQTAAPPNSATLKTNEPASFFKEKIWCEPEPADGQDVIYPNNQVRVSETGITEEWDDTPGNVRMHNFHPSGTYEEIVDDGTKTIRVIGKNYELYMNGSNMYVEGNLNVTVSGDKRELIMGDSYTEIEGNEYITVKGSTYRKVGKNVDTEIGNDHNENIGGSEVRLINGSQTETTVMNEYHIVNGLQGTMVAGDATFTYNSNKKTKIALNEEEVITGTKKKIISKSEQVVIKGGRTEAVDGNETTSITGNRVETVSGSDVETVKGAKTTTVTNNYTRTSSSGNIYDNATQIHHN